MSYFNSTYIIKRVIMISALVIVSLILWNTYSFFKLFKSEERAKMEIFAAAIKELSTNNNLNESMNLELMIFEKINKIPAISIDEERTILRHHNLDESKVNDPIYLEKELEIMKSQNLPLKIEYLDKIEYIYYRNSDLLNKLKYYPLALVLILALFLGIILMMFVTNKISEQNRLWTGMAKETAHQIGTPLSSLLGWIAILKNKNVNEKYIDEIEKDVYRLNTIANRFSKIGSLPELKNKNIVLETKKVFDYLESRASKQVTFSFSSNSNEIIVDLNEELFGWVIENLIKNAIDAMQGKGDISLNIRENKKQVELFICDSGKGISKKKFKHIFKPGYTSKPRGWGLGLSLSKRIIEDYHKGKVSVLQSEIGKGTTFLILLDKVS